MFPLHPTALWLVRHGQSTGNVARDVAEAGGAELLDLAERDADVPLSDLGREQADALGQWLADLPPAQRPTLAVSSPYRRALDTAVTALAELDIALRVDERLRDRELGVLDLLTWKGVLNRFPGEAERRRWLGKFYHRPPGGESWADVVLRVRSFLADLAAVPDGTRAVVFCHDALVLTFRYVCEGLSEREVLDIGTATPVKNVSITHLGRDGDGRWQVRLFNDVCHLEESPAPVTEHPGEGHVHPQS